MQFLFFFWGCDEIGNLSYEVEVLKTYSIPSRHLKDFIYEMTNFILTPLLPTLQQKF